MTRGKGNFGGGRRVPAGASPAQQYDRPSMRTSAAWPGWTDDPEGRCICSWSVMNGVRQVKFANSGCPVRHRARAAAGTATGESGRAEVAVVAPPGTGPGRVREMAERLAADARPLAGEAAGDG